MSPAENRRSVVIPDDLWERLEQASYRLTGEMKFRVSVSSIIRAAAEEWLERNEREEGK